MSQIANIKIDNLGGMSIWSWQINDGPENFVYDELSPYPPAEVTADVSLLQGSTADLKLKGYSDLARKYKIEGSWDSLSQEQKDELIVCEDDSKLAVPFAPQRNSNQGQQARPTKPISRFYIKKLFFQTDSGFNTSISDQTILYAETYSIDGSLTLLGSTSKTTHWPGTNTEWSSGFDDFSKQGTYNDIAYYGPFESSPFPRLAFSQWQDTSMNNVFSGEGTLPRWSIGKTSNSSDTFSLNLEFAGNQAYLNAGNFFEDYILEATSTEQRMGLLPNSNMFVLVKGDFLEGVRTAETAKITKKQPVIALIQDDIFSSHTKYKITRRTGTNDQAFEVEIKQFMYNGVTHQYKDYKTGSTLGNDNQTFETIDSNITDVRTWENLNTQYELVGIEPEDRWSDIEVNFFLETTVQGWGS